MDLERINTLWEGAERLRSHLDSADYKRLVLGLVFLKHLSDDSEARVSGSGKTPFQVPAIARWEAIRSQAGQSDIANRIDDAILALHRSNPSLAVILPARFASAAEVAPGTIGGLIDLLSPFRSGANDPAVDTLGEVFEWLLEQFAQTGGKKGGRFHTPASLTRLLLEVLSPRAGRIYDPACGEGDILIQCGKYATNRGSGKEGFSLFGQEADPAAWRLAAMHLAVQGMAADLGTGPGDPFARDYHPGLRFDYILAVTLFAGTSRSSELVPDPRWSYGTPSSTRDGFAWLQLVLWHLAPSGFAGVVLGNGSMHSNQGTDGAIRRALVEGDQVEVMIALPPGLFSNSLIPACVWFLAKDKTKEGRDRRRECLFIDTGSYGWVESPSRRVLQSEDIRRIARTVHAWRQDGGAREAYADIPGFCRSVGLAEIAEQGFLLTPKRYVGGGGTEDGGLPGPSLAELQVPQRAPVAPARTLNIVGVETAHGLKTLELALGNLCDIQCDVLGVSAFRDDYVPMPGTLVGALFARHGFSLEEAVQDCEFDLRNQFGIWIARKQDGMPFKRVLCVEMSGRVADPALAMENFFVGVAILEAKGIAVSTLALPLLGTGNQAYDPARVVEPLLKHATDALRRSANVDRIIFSEISEDKAFTINRELNRQLGGEFQSLLPRRDLTKALLEDLRTLIGRLRPRVDGVPQSMATEILTVVTKEDPTAMEVGLSGRRLAELVTDQIQPGHGFSDLAGKIDGLRACGIAPWLVSYLHTLRIIGNEVVHIREQSNRNPKSLAEDDVALCLFCMVRVTQFWLDQVLEKARINPK